MVHVVLLLLSLAAYVIFFLGVFLGTFFNSPTGQEPTRRYTITRILLMVCGAGLWVVVVVAWVWVCVKSRAWRVLGEAKDMETRAAGLEATVVGAMEQTQAGTTEAARPGLLARAASSMFHGRVGRKSEAHGADGAADEAPAWARGWTSNDSSAVWVPRANIN
jgi:hypothetical protein